MQPVLWAPLTAFAVALAAIAWLARSRISAFALDRPNPRSLHQSPVPRTGGIGLHAGVFSAWALTGPNLPVALWIGLGLLLTVSVVEDVRGVPVAGRLAAHLLAAVVLAASLLLQDFGIIAAAVVALSIAWMANLYNFMDGSDGLAGGMTVFGFSFYGVAASLSGSTAFAALNFSVAAAAAAFLVFNFHPARVFMGDVGSVPIGYLAAAMGLIGWLERDWTAWFPLLVFSPFIVDASVTLARRLAKRERVWEAHRDHYYQRLVQMGWGHRKTAWTEYTLMAACGLAALTGQTLAPATQVLVLATAGLVYVLLIASIELAWKRSGEER